MDGSRPSTCAQRRCGFTLVELIVTLAVAAVLVAGVIPGFQQLVARNRQTAHLNTVVASLALARSRAVDQGYYASLCPSLDGETCADTFRWDRGWLVFTDTDGNGRRAPEEPLIRAVQALNGTRIFTSTRRRHITFRSTGARGGSGSSGGSNATFTFCRSASAAESSAAILSNVGRVRVERPAPSVHAEKCGDGTTGY